MATVIYHQVELRGHERDLAPLLAWRDDRIMDGIVGDGWDASAKAVCAGWRTLEFFSRYSPLAKDVAALSKRHPRVLIQWSHFYAEGSAEGIVVACGGQIHAAGWWLEPHEDGGTCIACDATENSK